MHLRFSQLRAPLLAAFAVGATLLLLDISLTAAFGYRPQKLPPLIFWSAIDRFQSHVAAVENLQRSGQITGNQLVVILGSSTVEHDFDCTVLHDSDPLHRYWLIMGAGALNFTQIESYSRVLRDSALHPALVLIGMEQSLTDHEDEESPGEIPPALRAFPHDLRMHRVGSALRDCLWLDRNRDLVENANTVLLYDAAARIRHAFSLPTSAAQPPAPNPWDVLYLPDLHGTPQDVQGKWNWRMALLDPAHFRSPTRATSALANLVTEMRNRGATVIGILMPHTARLRLAYTPLVNQRFHEALTAATAAGLAKLLDVQSSIPDDLFYDDAHLNTPGKQQFSALLPALLQ